MDFLRDIPVSTKVTLANVIGMLILGGSVLFVVAGVLKAELERQAIEMQRLTIEIAWSTLNETGSGFTIRDGKLLLAEVALNDNTAMVDKVRRLTGGSATIFQGDTRIATNVLKEDGTRAVGTRLARGPAYDAVFDRGESYRGPVEILGQPTTRPTIPSRTPPVASSACSSSA